MDWRHRAACRGEDDSIFFTYNNEFSVDRAAAAKATCDRCGVRERCLEWALRMRISDGIFGGATPNERVEIQRAAARRRVGTTELIAAPHVKTTTRNYVTRWHVVADGVPACGQSKVLDMAQAVPAGRVADVNRCTSSGCAARWRALDHQQSKVA